MREKDRDLRRRRQRRIKRLKRRAQEEAAHKAAEKPQAERFNRAKMLERMGDDEQLVDEVINLFVEDCPTHLSAIRKAVESRDGAALRASAHALKGASGNLAATGLSQAAATLERVGAENRMDAAEAASRVVMTEASLLLEALRGSNSGSSQVTTCAR